MQTAPEPKLRSTLVLKGLSGEEASGFLRHQAKHHNLTLEEDAGGGLSCVTPFATVSLKIAGEAPEFVVQAQNSDMLYLVQENISEHLNAFDAQRAQDMRWSSIFTPGSYPPNFRLAEVVSVERPNDAYNRVRIKAENLADFADGAMHFRLLIPASGAVDAADYPKIGDNGQTVWPKGDDALHRPVYTTRRIDTESGWLEFDVFRHEGGRATEWSEKAVPGTRIGLMGPGGGAMPRAKRIVLAGDETALPAISRILEHLDQDASGIAFLLSSDGRVAGDFEAPEGMDVRPIARNGLQHPLLSAMKDLPLSQDAPFIWFASEKSEIKAARAHFEALDWFDPEANYLAAYWTAR